eukprot:scaffold249406_cov33-Tisochrysis_lutea.AAC.2
MERSDPVHRRLEPVGNCVPDVMKHHGVRHTSIAFAPSLDGRSAPPREAGAPPSTAVPRRHL